MAVCQRKLIPVLRPKLSLVDPTTVRVWQSGSKVSLQQEPKIILHQPSQRETSSFKLKSEKVKEARPIPTTLRRRSMSGQLVLMKTLNRKKA